MKGEVRKQMFIVVCSFSTFSAFEQDLTDLTVELPRLPKDLPFVVLQTQDGRKPKLEIKVRPDVLKKALKWLITYNPWYSQYTINEENMEFYEQNPTITENDLTELVQDWEPTPEEEEPQFRAMGEKDQFYEEDLDGDFPHPDGCVGTGIPSNTNEGIIKESLAKATSGRSTTPNTGPNDPLNPEADIEENADQEPSNTPPNQNDPSEPNPDDNGEESNSEEKQARPTLAWPRKSKKPLSEFEAGYFAKCYPHLFPDGVGDFLMPVSDNI